MKYTVKVTKTVHTSLKKSLKNCDWSGCPSCLIHWTSFFIRQQIPEGRNITTVFYTRLANINRGNFNL